MCLCTLLLLLQCSATLCFVKDRFGRGQRLSHCYYYSFAYLRPFSGWAFLFLFFSLLLSQTCTTGQHWLCCYVTETQIQSPANSRTAGGRQHQTRVGPLTFVVVVVVIIVCVGLSCCRRRYAIRSTSWWTTAQTMSSTDATPLNSIFPRCNLCAMQIVLLIC